MFPTRYFAARPFAPRYFPRPLASTDYFTGTGGTATPSLSATGGTATPSLSASGNSATPSLSGSGILRNGT